MPTEVVNGVRLFWEMTGEGSEPLVLVHGSWGDHENWAPVAPGLSRSFRVLTDDRRGHSRSERLSGQGSVREDVGDLAALLESTGHAPAHVVGSSFGASIVLRLAVERPELFRSLVAHEPPLFGLLKEEPGAKESLAAVQERISATASLLEKGRWEEGARRFVETVALGPGAWPGLPEEVRETFVFNAPTWLDEVRDPEALELDLGGLRDFSAPTLLTMGDQSASHFPLVVERLASVIPHVRRWTYRGGGHVPHLSHSAEYVRIVEAFARGEEIRP